MPCTDDGIPHDTRSQADKRRDRRNELRDELRELASQEQADSKQKKLAQALANKARDAVGKLARKTPVVIVFAENNEKVASVEGNHTTASGVSGRVYRWVMDCDCNSLPRNGTFALLSAHRRAWLIMWHDHEGR